MATISVHDKAIVLVLKKKEAEALKKRLDLHTGVRETKPLLKVKEQLSLIMGDLGVEEK